MLSSFKSKAPEKDKNAAANAAEVMERTVQQQHSVVEQAGARPEPTTKAGTGSCIGSGNGRFSLQLVRAEPPQIRVPTIVTWVRRRRTKLLCREALLTSARTQSTRRTGP